MKSLVNMSANTGSTPPEEFLNLLDQMQEIISKLKSELRQSSLFNYPTNPPEAFVQDFFTRFAYDLIRNKEEFERYVRQRIPMYLSVMWSLSEFCKQMPIFLVYYQCQHE